MGAIGSKITGVSIFCITVYWGAYIKRLRVTGLYEGNAPVTAAFPSQMGQMFQFDDVI